MNEYFIELREFLDMKDRTIKSNLLLIIVCVLLVTTIIFSLCYKKEKYYENYIVINDNNTYIIADRNKLDILKNNNKLIVDNEEYSYKIKEISKEQEMLKVRISVDFDRCYVDNISFKYRVHDNDERLIKYVLNIIKGGN